MYIKVQIQIIRIYYLVVVEILKYEFSNFWWGFKVVKLLIWPGYLPNTLVYGGKETN